MKIKESSFTMGAMGRTIVEKDIVIRLSCAKRRPGRHTFEAAVRPLAHLLPGR